MAGYHGYSMSNNAVEAYESGEKPMSKWTKAAITEEIEAMTGESEEKVKAVLKPYTLAHLRSSLIVPTSWHHTSCRYNRTEFYMVEDLETLEAIEDRLSGKEEADRLARWEKERAEFLRLEEKYDGKMPLDKAALEAIWIHTEQSLREHAERQGFSWLFSKYGTEKAIAEHEAEIDALNWVPADRLRMLRIMNLPDDATED